jgi:hypothetical protein
LAFKIETEELLVEGVDQSCRGSVFCGFFPRIGADRRGSGQIIRSKAKSCGELQIGAVRGRFQTLPRIVSKIRKMQNLKE